MFKYFIIIPIITALVKSEAPVTTEPTADKSINEQILKALCALSGGSYVHQIAPCSDIIRRVLQPSKPCVVVAENSFYKSKNEQQHTVYTVFTTVELPSIRTEEKCTLKGGKMGEWCWEPGRCVVHPAIPDGCFVPLPKELRTPAVQQVSASSYPRWVLCTTTQGVEDASSSTGNWIVQ